MTRRPRRSTFFPYTTLFRSRSVAVEEQHIRPRASLVSRVDAFGLVVQDPPAVENHGRLRWATRLECSVQNHAGAGIQRDTRDRKSTRLNSSHLVISYAVFCL